MKRFVKLMALMLSLVFVLAVAVGCGKQIDGTYRESTMGLTSFTFTDDEFVYNIVGAEVKGTYEIRAQRIHFTVTGGPAARIETFNEQFGEGLAFSEGEKEDGTPFIKIGGVTYLLKAAG